MQSAEIELKFPVSDLSLLEQRLPALGLHLVTSATFEQNTLFDTPDRRLRTARQILRLRCYGDRWTVTHKRVPGTGDDTKARYKTRIETETEVEDGSAMAEIFKQLGYSPVFRYEKYRAEWATSSGPLTHLVLDRTPIGNFAELEGTPEWIDGMLARLGIDPSACLTDSYGKLFLAWKQRTGSAADNLTFEEIPESASSTHAL
jgi:adenylate cyclase class 2